MLKVLELTELRLLPIDVGSMTSVEPFTEGE
jgi:hypothetical protein